MKWTKTWGKGKRGDWKREEKVRKIKKIDKCGLKESRKGKLWNNKMLDGKGGEKRRKRKKKLKDASGSKKKRKERKEER